MYHWSHSLYPELGPKIFMFEHTEFRMVPSPASVEKALVGTNKVYKTRRTPRSQAQMSWGYTYISIGV
jgi:hypothetical protein